MPSSKSDLASKASMESGFSRSAADSTSAFTRRNSRMAASYSRTAARWDGGGPRRGVPSVGLVLEKHEIVGLVLVHADDAGHGGVIEAARSGQCRLQQAKLFGRDLDAFADVLREPANLADGVPVLLALGVHLVKRRAG